MATPQSRKKNKPTGGNVSMVGDGMNNACYQIKGNLSSGKQSPRLSKVNKPAHAAAVNRTLRKVKQETDYKAYFLLFLVILITLMGNPGGWEAQAKVSNFHVFYYGWITAISTGIGALPFFFIKEPDKFWMGVSNAIAGGMMISASRSLFLEGIENNYLGMDDEDKSSTSYGLLGMLYKQSDPAMHGLYRTVAGVIFGLIFIYTTKRVLDSHEDVSVGEIAGSDAKKMILIMFVMTLHSLSEGVGIGVSFGGETGMKLGQFISLSLAMHNIPEGLAVALVLKSKHISNLRTVLWAIFTSLPQPIFAIPAYMFVERFAPLLPGGLGFAAGAMGYVAVFELLLESAEDTRSWKTTGIICAVAFVAMTVVQAGVKQAI